MKRKRDYPTEKEEEGHRIISSTAVVIHIYGCNYYYFYGRDVILFFSRFFSTRSRFFFLSRLMYRKPSESCQNTLLRSSVFRAHMLPYRHRVVIRRKINESVNFHRKTRATAITFVITGTTHNNVLFLKKK